MRFDLRGLALGAAALCAGLGMPAAVQAVEQQSAPAPNTPIKHFIVLMQENHSFDNYFGTYPGADGISSDTCMPVDPTDIQNRACVSPFHLGARAIQALNYTYDTHELQFRDGHMDGFIYAFRKARKDGTLTMGYYDEQDLPFYWNLADEYVLFDRFYSSAAGGRVKNHMYWVAAQPGSRDDRIPPQGWGDIPTIFDRLQERGISWKFYVQNYDPKITFRNGVDGDRGAQVVRVPLLAFSRYIDDPQLSSHIVDLDEYFEDLHNGTLPAVAYIAPSGNSERPPSSIAVGQRFVKNLLNALMQSDAWESSAFMLTYDTWGGWYDHVSPPRVDEDGYGFRVPALLVSPYARRGYVDNTSLDFTSILRFIEDNYGLQPMTDRDTRAKSIVGAFDFSQPPRQPQIVARERQGTQRAEPRRDVIYYCYGVALILAGMIMISAIINSDWVRVRPVPIEPRVPKDGAP
jgi:phospholipase C